MVVDELLELVEEVVVCVVLPRVVKLGVGKIGQPRNSIRMEMRLFQELGITLIHFALIGHVNMFVTGVFSSLLPSNTCNRKQTVFITYNLIKSGSQLFF